MSPLVITAIASGISAVFGGGLVSVILKGLPERRNITTEAQQRAVALLVATMDELTDQLEAARKKIDELTQMLDQALGQVRELEQALNAERDKVRALEQRLRSAADAMSE